MHSRHIKSGWKKRRSTRTGTGMGLEVDDKNVRCTRRLLTEGTG